MPQAVSGKLPRREVCAARRLVDEVAYERDDSQSPRNLSQSRPMKPGFLGGWTPCASGTRFIRHAGRRTRLPFAYDSPPADLSALPDLAAGTCGK